MDKENVGICAMEMYFPKRYVSQEDLEDYDEKLIKSSRSFKGKYTKGLGQKSMSFCSDVEDINSICLTVVQRLFDKTGVDPSEIGFLEVGTETLIDKSKSTKTELMSLFGDNTDIVGLTNLNACYGGTAALMHAIKHVQSPYWDGRLAIVVAADIAVYDPTNLGARVTGGVGAVAMLIGPDAPVIVEHPFPTHSENVYDFYKANTNTEYPEVDGHQSIICYLRALDQCYFRLLSKQPEASLNSFDYTIFHSPFCALANKGLMRLRYLDSLYGLSKKVELSEYKESDDVVSFVNMSTQRSFFNDLKKDELAKEMINNKLKPGQLFNEEVGNIYTASLFASLTGLLANGADTISDKSVLAFSYGSGLVASIFGIRFRGGDKLTSLCNSTKKLAESLATRQKCSPTDLHEATDRRANLHARLQSAMEVGEVLKVADESRILEEVSNNTFCLIEIDCKYIRSYGKVLDGKIVPLKSIVPTVNTIGLPLALPAVKPINTRTSKKRSISAASFGSSYSNSSVPAVRSERSDSHSSCSCKEEGFDDFCKHKPMCLTKQTEILSSAVGCAMSM